jgi:phosphate:Na+ symporter
LLTSIDNPLLLLLIGIFLTALIQSSSAVTTIVISMVAAGMQIGSTPNAVLFLILGTNIGTCVTALLSSVGATPNARRTSIIHLLFNLFGTGIFVIILLLWKNFAVDILENAFPEPTTQIAMFHTIFNVVSTLIFIPFIKVFIKLSEMFVKDKKKETRVSYLDERFLATPAIAVMQATREVAYLGSEAMRALDLSLEGLLKKDPEYKSKVFEIIDNIEECNKNILTYMVKLSSKELSIHDEKKISNLHSIINDFIREAEIADNVVKHTRTMIDKDITFSEEVVQSLYEIKDLLARQYDNVEAVLIKKDHSVLESVDKIEDRIDTMRVDLTNGHIKRLEEGTCQPQSSGVFINLISNLERAGDHLHVIAHNVVK